MCAEKLDRLTLRVLAIPLSGVWSKKFNFSISWEFLLFPELYFLRRDKLVTCE